MQGLLIGKGPLCPWHPRTCTQEALPKGCREPSPSSPTGSHGGCEGKAKNTPNQPTNPTKTPTRNHHTTIHALHTGLKSCPILDTRGWNTSSANIEVEWLKKLASYVEYILFNLAFATCPFGALSMGMGTAWLLQLSQAQGSALPCLHQEALATTRYPHPWQQQSKHLTPPKSMDRNHNVAVLLLHLRYINA